MHELSVTTRILDIALSALEANNLTKICSITVDIGAMNDYEDEWLQKFFNQISEGTAAEGAKLYINHLPFKFKCRQCNHEFTFDVKGKGEIKCEKCGSDKFDMTSGRQFDIVDIRAE